MFNLRKISLNPFKTNEGFTIIYSTTGKKLAKFSLENKFIDVSSLGKGTYFVKSIAKNGEVLDSTKLIIQ